MQSRATEVSASVVPALVALRSTFGPEAARAKLGLLARLVTGRVAAGEVLYLLHETLLYLCAFPDSPAVAEAAEAALSGFVSRVLSLSEEERAAIDERGLAGTAIYTSYSLPVVRSLHSRRPAEVSCYDEAEGAEEAISGVLASGLLAAEAEATADGYVTAREWLARVASFAPARRDLGRLLDLVRAATPDPRLQELLWAVLGVSIRWEMGAGSGSRTRARAPRGTRVYQEQPLDRGPVDLATEVARGPLPVERARGRTARAWLDLCRDVLAARLREVHTYTHGSLADIHVADAGGGLRIVTVGVEPAARHAVRAFTGYLLVKNDVPIGYGDAVLLFEWGEINFHVFDTFRQADSARVYATVLRLFYHRFGTRFVFLNRYQFGHHNEDAIRSGAFWFYEKLGFRPHEPEAVRVWQAERARLERDHRHRTSAARLRVLARGHMDLVLVPGAAGEALAREVRGFHPLALGFAVSRAIERRFKGDRPRAAEVAATRLRARLEACAVEPRAGSSVATSWSGGSAACGRQLPPHPKPGQRPSGRCSGLDGRFDAEEGQALAGLAPLVELGIMLDRWSRSELRALAAILRAKAAVSERDFVLRTQDHPRLRAALLRLGGARGPRTARGGRHVPENLDRDRRK